jgi:3-deoxy-D-manno-octulosonic-acid transferase
MMLLYEAGIKFYGGLIFLASTFYSKANLWIKGRKNWRNTLSKKYPQQKKVIWFHCASVGEFEQGRPLIEKIKTNHPDYFILLTFFSPSAFELRKNYPFADFICYLPLDTKKNAKDFISLINPELVIFVKYEIWLNFLFELKERNIPTILISAYFNEKSNFFKGFLKYLYSEAFQSFIIIFTFLKIQS